MPAIVHKSSVMLVYRLENTKGHGPFNTGQLYEFVDMLFHQDKDRYPSTYLAFLRIEQDDVGNKPHGCKSLRELLYWFPAKVIRQMRGRGFGVAVYEVDRQHIIFGKFQLVFDPDHAKRIQFK